MILKCKQSRKFINTDIVNVVGEIFPDPEFDRDSFSLCNAQSEILQYYAFQEKSYSGEKFAIEEAFRKNFIVHQRKSDNGWLRIRFIVNCMGQAGRFRIEEMDRDYRPKKFSRKLVDQLLKITKSLKDWKAMSARGIDRDYYQYLLFKIEHGAITEILP